RGAHAGREGGAGDPRWRCRDGVRSGLPDESDHLRQYQRHGQPGPAAQGGSLELRSAHRGEYAAPDYLPGEAAEPEPGDAEGVRNSMSDETYEIIGPGHTYESVTEKISGLILTNKIGRGWLLAVAFFGFLTAVMFIGITITLLWGVGLWG